MSPQAPQGGKRTRTFTLDEANRTLPLVSRVVRDVVEQYVALTPAQEELEKHKGQESATPDLQGRIAELERAIEERVALINGYLVEINQVGCELKDFRTGLVDFPAWHDGRLVFLCWRLGEEQVAYWHEVRAGVRGRKPVGSDF